jgi:hypothetical protein
MRPMKYCLSGAAGAVALGFATLSAQAAPVGAAPADLKANAPSSVQQVRYYRRHCWWHHGHRHCRRHYRHYGPSFSFYGPGIGFYLGSGYRHHRHGRHHHRRHHHRKWSHF